MKVLVFEFMTGGGVAAQPPLNNKLSDFLRQGRSMLEAVCEDMLELEAELVVPVDASIELALSRPIRRLNIDFESELDSVLIGAADSVDHILLIAPESDGVLEHYAELLSPWAGRFLGPDLDFIRLTGNKWTCHQWLSHRNVPCPETTLVEFAETPETKTDSFPLVAKPIDGCGSEGVILISEQSQLAQIESPYLLQQFVAGTAASVSVIVDSKGERHLLSPGRQIFATEPFGIHMETEYPLEGKLKDRALSLAQRVIDALPTTRGYFGIDMVLGETLDEDVVIEVNPRLTTSYGCLQQWCAANQAQLILPLQ